MTTTRTRPASAPSNKATGPARTKKPAAASSAAKGNIKAQQRQASLAKILESALRIFVRKGYSAATVDDIAQACELTKGAVYFYFSSKSAVLHALFDQIEQVIVQGVIDSIDRAGPRQTDKLIAYLHSGAGLGNVQPQLILLYILMLLEFNGTGDELESRVKALYQRIAKRVESVIEAGQKTGEFRTDLAIREMSSIVMALFNGTFMEWYCRPRLLDGPELVKVARVTALNGLLLKPAQTRKAS